MTLTEGDLRFYHSIPSASSGWSATSEPSTSFGKYVSTTSIWGSFFENITKLEHWNETPSYTCIFAYNYNTVDTMYDVRIFGDYTASRPAYQHFAVDNIAASARNASSQQAAFTSGRLEAPTGVGTWKAEVDCTDYAGGIQLGTLAPEQVRAFWIKMQPYAPPYWGESSAYYALKWGFNDA